ncbi:MAG TPA: glucosaminidase domain-containing protein [Polyangiaceae bacterium]|nr:glucosaminidase domain-containing protein [Polyangiaceae bacterium]
MAEFIPHAITPITPTVFASALVAGWRTFFGGEAPRQAIVLLMAQSAHETASWKYVHNFNIGNIKAVDGDGYDWTMFRCREKVGGNDVWLDPPNPGTRFRAFRSLTEGAIDHLAFLYGRARYATAWAELKSGDPLKFATALRAAGYYTDPVDVYAGAVTRYAKQFGASLPAELEPHPVDDDTARRVQGLVALSLAALRLREDFGAQDTEQLGRDPDLAGMVADTEPAPPDDEKA